MAERRRCALLVQVDRAERLDRASPNPLNYTTLRFLTRGGCHRRTLVLGRGQETKLVVPFLDGERADLEATRINLSAFPFKAVKIKVGEIKRIVEKSEKEGERGFFI